MICKFTFDGGPEVERGKQIVEPFLAGKGATSFEWDRDFNTRNWTVKFEWNGRRHICLTDLPKDPLKEAKLEALWENKTEI